MKQKTKDRLLTTLSLIVLPVIIWAYFKDHLWLQLSVTVAFLGLIGIFGFIDGTFATPEYAEAVHKSWWVSSRFGLPLIAGFFALIFVNDYFNLPDWISDKFLLSAMLTALLLFQLIIPVGIHWRAGRRIRKRRLQEEEGAT